MVFPAHADNLPKLYLYNWNNYISQDVVSQFEKECKCHVVQDYYSDNEEMLAKIASGAAGYDLIVPTGNAVESLIKQKELLPFDYSQLPNFHNIKPEFRGMWFDAKNQFSIPYAYTITLLGYNVEKMKALGIPTNTWAAIFEPKYLEKIKGKVTVLDSQRELMSAAMRYLGYSINDTDPEKWKRARNVILKAKPYWAAFNAGSYAKELSVGNIWLAHGYSGDMFTAQMEVAAKKPEAFHIEYSTPKEGAVLAVDNMVIHRTSKNPELAHRFVNFMLEGKNSAELTNLIGVGNPNTNAMRYIKPNLANNRTIFPAATELANLEMLKDLDRHHRRLLNRYWIQIKVN